MKSTNQPSKNRRGFTTKQSAFTLIELLVVIAIIGILATVVIASLNSARAKARDAKRISDLKQVQTALEMYYADNGVYPGNGHYSSTFVTGSTMCGALSAGAHWSVVLTGTFSTFLPTLPVDPSSGCYIYSRVGTSGVNCNLPGGGVVNLASREYVLGFKAEQNLTSQYPYFGTGSDAVYCIFGPIK